MNRSLSPGRILYLLWHRPIGKVRECISVGGPMEQHRTAQGEQAMIAAARLLAPPSTREGAPLSLHLLTGHRFWHQTAFCLHSFSSNSRRLLAPVIYDDGTLRHEEETCLQRIFPLARFVTKKSALALLEHSLPQIKYPYLHDRWMHYPNIRKLIDPHIASPGWKLVIDSDLLFFRNPTFLVDWLDAPDRPLHAVDCETSYGYDRAFMNRLTGAPVADLVNVGLTGLRSDEIDWDRVEYFCRELISTAGTHYYLEQALVAMLVAGRGCSVASSADYVTRPSLPEANHCTAVMHHYVADSKKWYFRHNWRRVLAHNSDSHSFGQNDARS